MRLNLIYIQVIILLCLSSFAIKTDAVDNVSVTDIQLLTQKNTFQAGDTITLQFSTTESITPLMYCTNSYGSTLIKPSNKDNKLYYRLPQNLSHKIGSLYWKLLNDTTHINGEIKIIPKTQAVKMETYIGPPSIEAGGTDYTMLVVIPTDELDNPLPEHTSVTAKHQFLNEISIDSIQTKNLIAYKTINSKDESGRMLVSSESVNINSKEFTINVLPAIPKSFTISAEQPHNYADGNQQTVFSTSILKDKYGNIVSDGTFVTFSITTSEGTVLKTYGTTIKGIAQARMIHPDHQAQWHIKAYVAGMAESNTIDLNFQQVIKDFNVEFSKHNRTITVGPLQSFMNQMIPDGLQVKLFIYKNNELLEQLNKTSVDGYVRFNLKPNIVQNDSYDFIIKTAGIEQSFNTKTLW
ncbi:hypothetical protein [uncultured Psychroserpens sp.]|uniref:hypothetical protein n=1 Tax=uncultured Psychroserpens sp. TaxID=255436 RepID=UPI00262AE648|nr:hypothetical protein [uncultured Psychroserpens sp.]